MAICSRLHGSTDVNQAARLNPGTAAHCAWARAFAIGVEGIGRVTCTWTGTEVRGGGTCGAASAGGLTSTAPGEVSFCLPPLPGGCFLPSTDMSELKSATQCQ